MSERRALVTGATGFVGSHLVPALRASGWEVHVVARPGSDAGRVSALGAMGGVVHVHDGSHADLERIVEAARPSLTWHLATNFIPRHVATDVVPLVRANVEFGAMVLDALTRNGASPAVVTAGTAWQQHDNASYSPMSLYAATKEAFDAIAAYYAEVADARLVECFLFDTYGPGDTRRKILWQLANAVQTGDAVKLSGEGGQYVDFVHIDDVVRALVCAGDRAEAARPGTQERWAVRSPASVTVRELVERCGRAWGTTVPVEWNARPPRRREMNVPWSAGALLPGWTPRISLDEGLAALRG